MGAVPSGVSPKSFLRIQVGRIFGQRLDLQPVCVGINPALHQRLLVIGRVIVNKNGALPPIASGQALQKGQVGFCVEDTVSLIMKPCLPHLDGPEDLDALALPGHGNLRRMSNSTPGGVQGGILTETGFVGKNQRPVFLLGVFFSLG